MADKNLVCARIVMSDGQEKDFLLRKLQRADPGTAHGRLTQNGSDRTIPVRRVIFASKGQAKEAGYARMLDRKMPGFTVEVRPPSH